MISKHFRINQTEELACKVLNGSIKDVPATESFFMFAIANQVAATAGHIIKNSKEKFSEIEQKFIGEHTKVQNYLGHYLDELDQLAYLLMQSGIRVVALKNAGIARGIYDCYGCCPMGDVDLLVSRKDFLTAHTILLNNNYNFKYRSILEKENIQNAIKSGGAEYYKELKTGEKLWLELQFRSVAGRWICHEQEPEATGLLERSVKISGTEVRILSPEDNLLQVALHTAKHSFVRAPGFRLHTDVDRIVRYQKVDWDLFVENVIKLKVKTAVYISLLIPCELLGTPIPDVVLNTLSPMKIKTWLVCIIINKAGLFNPEEKKFSKITYILFNILLYDSYKLIFKNIFPNKEKMMDMYNCKIFLIPFFYLKRFLDLLLIRQKT